MSEYGRDIADVWRGTMTPELAIALIQGLGSGSRLHASMSNNPEVRGLTQDRVLAIYSANLLRLLLWTTSAQNSKKKPPKPDLLSVPGAKKTEEKPKENYLVTLLNQKKAQLIAEREARNQERLESA